jgi:GNAT superfamily N-acetyltransferase
VAEASPARPVIEPLGPHHNRAAFSCGVPELDRYLHHQAGQDARRRIAAPFVLVMPDGRIGGYYTLSATAVQLIELPAETARRLPRYPQVPAFLLGRLAVDRRYRGQGWGRFLLADALRRCVGSELAGFAVVVDAIDDEARGFYAREGFLSLPDTPNRLFRRITDIVAVLRDIDRETGGA